MDTPAQGLCHYVIVSTDFASPGVHHARLKCTSTTLQEALEPFAIIVEEITAGYCTLWEIKSELALPDDTNDDLLMSMISDATQFIKDYTHRSFISELATRYFDGSASPLWLDDDLMSVTGTGAGVFLDEDGNGTYESTLTANTDYLLLPYNTTPKTRLVIAPNSSYGGFASGITKGVKITGYWGYSTTPPDTVRRACKIQVCRWWNRHLGGYSTEIGGQELGTIKVYSGLDEDVKLLLKGVMNTVNVL
jgi:hypothetical protein